MKTFLCGQTGQLSSNHCQATLSQKHIERFLPTIKGFKSSCIWDTGANVLKFSIFWHSLEDTILKTMQFQKLDIWTFKQIFPFSELNVHHTVLPLRCATTQLRSTTRQFAQCYFILAHFQHYNLILRIYHMARLERFTVCVSAWLRNCMRSVRNKTNIYSVKNFLRENTANIAEISNLACKYHTPLSWVSSKTSLVRTGEPINGHMTLTIKQFKKNDFPIVQFVELCLTPSVGILTIWSVAAHTVCMC